MLKRQEASPHKKGLRFISPEAIRILAKAEEGLVAWFKGGRPRRSLALHGLGRFGDLLPFAKGQSGFLYIIIRTPAAYFPILQRFFRFFLHASGVTGI